MFDQDGAAGLGLGLGMVLGDIETNAVELLVIVVIIVIKALWVLTEGIRGRVGVRISRARVAGSGVRARIGD